MSSDGRSKNSARLSTTRRDRTCHPTSSFYERAVQFFFFFFFFFFDRKILGLVVACRSKSFPRICVYHRAPSNYLFPLLSLERFRFEFVKKRSQPFPYSTIKTTTDFSPFLRNNRFFLPPIIFSGFVQTA